VFPLNCGSAQICGSFIFFGLGGCFISGHCFAQKINLTTDEHGSGNCQKCQNCQRSPGVNVRTYDEFGGFSFSIWIFWQYSAVLAICLIRVTSVISVIRGKV
jgi:hypothetical protein